MEKKNSIRFAFQQTMPVLPGYLFLGIAFGLMLKNAGFHFLWAFAISVFVYAGSMQFVMVSLLTGGVNLIYVAMMTFFINGRHIFYGLSLVEKYRQMGKRYLYMIFSLTDETYSVMCRMKAPKDVKEKEAMFYISLFHHGYWVFGSLAGGLAGELITFDSTGIDFSMTAFFTAIVVEQWQEVPYRIPIMIGGVFSVVLLLLLGPDRFVLPALSLSIFLLLGLRGQLEQAGNEG